LNCRGAEDAGIPEEKKERKSGFGVVLKIGLDTGRGFL
jgi:hypothetical protein